MKTITYDQIRYPLDYLVDEKPSLEEVKALCLDIWKNPESYYELIAKAAKVKDLKQAIRYPHATKKAELVKELLSQQLNSLCRVNSLYYSMGGYDKALYEHMKKVFVPEVWEKEMQELQDRMEQQKAQVKAMVDGVENPATLEDFKRRVRVKGLYSLSPEQLAEHDRLASDDCRERRKKDQALYANRYAIDFEGLTFDLIDTKHTQKDYDLFVVQFTEWMPRRLWLKAYDRAKEFGGWYSGYDKDGAITGLQFKSDMQRKNYCENVLCGGAQLSEHIDEVKYLATLNASDRLIALAGRMLGKAQEDLDHANNAKSNTPRRARMQKYAVERQHKRAALAKTMHEVAKVIEGNPDHILSGIKYRTDFETLSAVGKKPNWYTVSKDMARRLYAECINKEAKLAEGMIRKRIRETKTDMVKFNAKIVTQLMNKGVEAWWLFEQHTHLARLNRMGIHTAAELRHAQRALATLTVAPEEEPEWVQMERDLIGTKIQGFFPTPPALIRAMCDAVNLTSKDKVLDPSCGKGDILEYAIEHYNVAQALGMEIVPKLMNLCNSKGLSEVWCKDALEANIIYDGPSVILMNPPFERQQAQEHFLHVWNNVEVGTRIACIIPNGATNGELTKLVEEHGGEITPNPEGAFCSAFRSTNVSTSLLVITKE